MKKRIYGRKAGSDETMVLLLESDGVSAGGQKVDPALLDQFAVDNARRYVKQLRERNVEGYVVFENDPMRYEFSPTADFVYPANSQ